AGLAGRAARRQRRRAAAARRGGGPPLSAPSAPADGLEVSIAGQAGALALDVALSVGAEPVLVLGPNGAGKTSLLLAILGLGVLRPRSGRIACGGDVLFDHRAGVDVQPE